MTTTPATEVAVIDPEFSDTERDERSRNQEVIPWGLP